ncbi:uroporphyrinogen decarboxylase [bacterium]|nr:uroporphyrinogen decarboxylase [bacterium]
MSKEIEQSPFIQACFGQETPYTPVWIMRQAGRYQKEYRDIRAKHSFLELCKSPELVSEVTCLAVDMLNVDAAIIFADILLILESLGFDLDFLKGHGPTIHNPFRLGSTVEQLVEPDIKNNHVYLEQAVALTRKNLPTHIPLIGFAGSPFTVASYAIEGGSSKNFEHTKKLMRSDPETFIALLDQLTEATIDYMKLQLDAGANAIQLFDSWIGVLSPQEAQNFAVPFAKQIFDFVKMYAKNVPTIYFGVNTAHLIKSMKDAGSDVMGIDFRTPLNTMKQDLNLKAVQGNLDPVTLLCDTSVIEHELDHLLSSINNPNQGYIFNLGHGILPNTPVEHAQFLVKQVHQKTKR